MSDAKAFSEPKQSENLLAVKDEYNPVNMAGKKAGKKIEKNDKPSQKKALGKDDYNPVNMAGKTAAPRKDDATHKNKRKT